MKKTLLIAFIFIGLIGYTQTVKVVGVLMNNQNEPLEMANVIIMLASDSSMAGFAFSDASGNFSADAPTKESVIVRVSYLGYESKDVSIETKTEKVSIGTVILKESNEVLNEVKVVEEMPIMISGDTISYKAEVFNSGNEKKLEDVLANLPGVEVDDDGQVTVEGKTVEKVMVEGKDFFDGDTKMATKNIPANAIDKIQVLRNYNDVSPLGGVSNNDDRIALNIKLKEGKKNIFFGDVGVEGGPDSRYFIHPNLFYYSPKASYNFIGDANNVGRPAFTMRDFFRFTGGFRGLNSRSGSSFNVAQDIGIPMTQSNRSTEYSSELGALNFSYNPKKSLNVSGFLIASHSNADNKSNTLKNYIGQDSITSNEKLSTIENFDDKSVMAKLSTKYTPNQKLHFEYDIFGKYSESDGIQDDFSDFGIVNRDIQSRDQQTPFSLNQNLGLYYDINEKSIISFEAQHLYKDQDPLYTLLTNTKPNFDIIPILDSSVYLLEQYRNIKTNKVDGIFNYYYILNSTNHIEFTAGGSYSGQQLTSSLDQLYGDSTVIFDDEDLVNDVQFNLSDVYGGVHYKTKLNKLTLKPGFNYHWYHTDDLQRDDQLKRNWYLFLPDLYAKYEFKKSASLTLNYNMQAGFTDVNNASLGVILKGYNSLFMGNRMLDNALYHSVNLRYFNFNMFNFTNIYAGLTYNKRINDIINGVQYRGIDLLNTPMNSFSANDVYSAYGSFQRRFGYYKIRLNANYSYALSNNLVNDQRNENATFNQSYRVEFGTNFKKAPNFEIGYRLSSNNYTGTGVSNTFINHKPYLEFEARFLKDFLFTADYEYNFYKASSNGSSSIYDFLDADLVYQKEDSKWEFRIGVTNVLNTEIIREDSFNNSVSTTSEVFVLPRYLMMGFKYNL